MNDLRHVTASPRVEAPPERKRGTPRAVTPGYRGERIDCKMCGKSARPDECEWGRWPQPEGTR